MEKYKLLKSEIKAIGIRTLFRIQALIDIPKHGVKAGDLGGFIEKEDNLSHERDAWVGEDASVYGDAFIVRDVLISGNATVYQSKLWGDMVVKGYANIRESTINGKSCTIEGKALIQDVNLEIENGLINGETTMMNVFGRNPIRDFGLQGNALIIGKYGVQMVLGGNDILIGGDAKILNAKHILGSHITITDNAVLEEGAGIKGTSITLCDYAIVTGSVNVSDLVVVSEVARIFSSKDDCKTIITGRHVNGDVELDINNL